MHRTCEHQLKLENSWLSGPQIVCQHCKKRWDVRGKTLADAGCWGLSIILVALTPLLFGPAILAFAGHGLLSVWIGYAVICLTVVPLIMVVHFAAFALGHWVHGRIIRRSGDLRRWIEVDPYHAEE